MKDATRKMKDRKPSNLPIVRNQAFHSHVKYTFGNLRGLVVIVCAWKTNGSEFESRPGQGLLLL